VKNIGKTESIRMVSGHDRKSKTACARRGGDAGTSGQSSKSVREKKKDAKEKRVAIRCPVIAPEGPEPDRTEKEERRGRRREGHLNDVRSKRARWRTQGGWGSLEKTEK